MQKNIIKITITGILVALEIILSRFCSYSVWNTKIGFAFIPVVICAMICGPVYSAILGGLADFLGAILFPIGAYFPGFTLTAALIGAIFGLFLYKKSNLLLIILSVLVSQIFCSLILNSYWISVLYGSPYGAVLISRIAQSAIFLVVQPFCIFLIDKFIIKKIKII